MDEKRLLRKVDLRILPLIWTLYLLNYIDRVNLGNVHTSIVKSLGLTENEFSLCVGIFFVGYVLFEIPSNLMLKKATPSRWIARIMVSWGIVSTCTMFVTNFVGLLMCRLFLGAMEAGFFPGIIFYLTFWYRKEEQAVRQSIFFTATTIAGAIAGLLAYFLLQLDGVLSLEGWQWVFLVEGIPSIIFGIVTWFYLPDFPATAKFLTPEERVQVSSRLESYVHSTEFNKKEFLNTFSDIQIWLFALLYVLVVNPLKAVTFFLPSIIESFHYNKLVSNLLTVPIYLLGAIMTVLIAYHSDKKNERAFHILGSSIVAMVGWILLSFLPSLDQYILAYFSCFLVVIGVFPSTVLTLTWLTNSIVGSTKGATSTAFVISCGNIGGFFNPLIFGFFLTRTGSYDYAIVTMAAFSLLACFLILFIRYLQQRSNRHYQTFQEMDTLADDLEQDQDEDQDQNLDQDER